MKKVEAAALIVGAGLLVMSWTMPGTAIEITRPEIEVTAATEIPAPLIVTGLQQDGQTLLPVRKVAEHFGYQVGWQEEAQRVTLTSGAQYITFSIQEDAYTFSKMAAQPLGSAPVLQEDTTYVPTALFTELMGLNCHSDDEGTFIVSRPSQGTIQEIMEDGTLSVQDEDRGEVWVHIGEHTVLLANGKPITKDALQVGQSIRIEYEDAMTASLPPQATAKQIEIVNLPVDADQEEENKLAFSGIISELPGDGQVIITPDGKVDPTNALCLIVTEDTQITRGMDKRIYKIDDLKVGDKISGLHGEITTMSIPPQVVAVKIQIEE